MRSQRRRAARHPRGPEPVVNGGVALAVFQVTVASKAFEGSGAYPGDASAICFSDGATDATISNNVVTDGGSGRGVISAMGAMADARLTGNSFHYLTSGVFAKGVATFWAVGNPLSNNQADSAGAFKAAVATVSNTPSRTFTAPGGHSLA